MDRRLILAINAVISIVLVAAILNIVGVGEVASELSSVSMIYIILGMASLFVMDLLMAYRIKLMLEESGVRMGFLDILRSHFVGMLLADFTPSRTGYFATAAVLRYNYDVPADKALLSIFGPQIFDFAFKVISGSLAIFYIMFVFIGPGQGLILIAGAAVISVLVVGMMLLLFSARFLGLFGFAGKLPVIGSLYSTMEKMQESSHVVVKKTPHIIALIFVSWFFRSLSWYLVAKSIGVAVDTPFPEILFYLFLQPLLTMLEFVPSPTIAGLGLSEGGATLVFSFFGVPAAKAATFALLTRFKTTLLHLPSVPEALKVLPKALPGK
ncbi:MAG: lysylphosphatidylglycerol synthase transmembrane domain-containing protein [Candidatus Micrarchaeia archaeon]